LIAANGTVTLDSNYGIDARGGTTPAPTGSTCYGGGGYGSGGAVRIVANTIRVLGSNSINVTSPGGAVSNGRVLLEAFNIEVTGSIGGAFERIFAPGPVSIPLLPSVAITEVEGAAVASPTFGSQGNVDVVVNGPGDVTVELETTNLPEGSTVTLTAKPRYGIAFDPEKHQAEPVVAGCNGTTTCSFSQTLEFTEPGTYFLQAQATFQFASP
jgi:hypothetical protein